MNVELTYYKNNLLFRMLLGSSRFRFLQFMAILSLWYVVGYGICAKYNALQLLGKDAGYFEDIVLLSNYFMYLAMIACSLFLLRKLDFLLERLPDLIDISYEELIPVINHIREFVSLRRRTAIYLYITILIFMCLLVLVFQIYIPIFKPQDVRAWAIMPDIYPTIFIFAVIFALFQWVIIVGNVFWYLLSIAITVFPVIYRYAREGKLQINPISPDGKGGLTPISDLSYALTICMSCGLILVVSWLILYGVDQPMMLGFPMYIVFLTVVFFMPLQSVHIAMKKAKNFEIYRIGCLFSEEYKKLPEGNNNKKSKSVGKHHDVIDIVRYLADLNQLYRRVEMMPVWPFNFTMLGRFLALIIVPMLLFVVQLTTENYLLTMIKAIVK